MPRFFPILITLALTLATGPACVGVGDTPATPSTGRVPNDARLQPLKDLDGYFPFEPPATREGWERRAERVRRQLLVTLGLWPMPSRAPLNAMVYGRIERDEYTVEKVCFESFPGFYVTGNLYRPKAAATGKRPGVLCPHGHWEDGRFTDAGVDGVRKQIVEGAERFEEGGRSPLQARCMQLARMGCVVFHYDMIGYADSVQIPQSLAHGFAKQRPEMNTREHWGLFSPQAESRFQSVMGLQTWNSTRCLDFLLGLPDVDASRIGVTGASGGGTQTFILSALDPRVTVAFPAVMVSTAMQGGCTCENACGLRVGTGNVEFAALFAPKPLGMTSADDWTREMSTRGFPQLKQLYTLLGAADHVLLKRAEHFGHNYNYVSRAAMYAWFNRHLGLGLKEPIVEPDYHRLTRAEMSVWDDSHPQPKGGIEFERALLRQISDDADEQLRQAQENRDAFRKAFGLGIDIVVGRSLADAGVVQWKESRQEQRGDWALALGWLQNATYHEEIPAVRLVPQQPNGSVVLWADPHGKAGLFARTDPPSVPLAPRPEILRLLEGGCEVVGVDLLCQGDFLIDGQPVAQTRRVKNTRESAAYTLGYNHSLFAQRVHDLLSVLSHLRSRPQPPGRVALVGLDGAGHWVAAACAQAAGAVHVAAVHSAGFRFAGIRDILDPDFLPGGAKYGDLPGMIALGAPARLWLAGEGSQVPELVQMAYRWDPAARATAFTGPQEGQAAAATAWLLTELRP